MLPEFQSVTAKTKDQALSLLSTLEDVRVVAGGTDILVKMRRGEKCSNVIDIGSIAGMRTIGESDGQISMGALSTHAEVSRNPIIRGHAASLALASAWVGSPQIRNMGTLGGNLVNASPAADSIPPLLIHDAVVHVESTGGERQEKIEEFIVAPYKTTMKKDELMTFVRIRGLKGYREGYKRVAKRAAWAISRLSVAWAIDEEDGHFREVRLAIGSCTPMPFRPVRVEEMLKGRRNDEATTREAVEEIITTIVDITGERLSFAYKIPVLRGLLTDILRG